MHSYGIVCPPSPRFVKVDMDLAAAALRAWYIISHGSEGDLPDHINFDNSGGRGKHTLCPFHKWYFISQKPDPEKCNVVWLNWDTSAPQLCLTELPVATISSLSMVIVSRRQAQPPHIFEGANKKQVANPLSELQ